MPERKNDFQKEDFMKVDRRSFLAFLVGGVVGTGLSPISAKITDDLSIWSQNWPWTPVPQDGETSHVNSTCTLCPGGCGITVCKVENRAVKIEGMKGHPVNDGGICLFGLSGLQLLYGPRRIKSPLKRVGKRGEGRWEKITWDDAINELSEKLNKLRTQGNADSLAWISGSENGSLPQLAKRFITAYGSPNYFSIPSIANTYESTLKMISGAKGTVAMDVENADYILSFGSGILDGWGSPVRMFKANTKWKKKGARVTQIEPRLSNTAAKADKWIPIKPGTEGILAYGLAKIIVDKNLYNNVFIRNYTNGFYEWKRKLKGFNVNRVAERTGLDEGTILSLAKDFAKAKKPLALCGRGRGSTPGSINEFMAVNLLNALKGNLNSTGGIWAVPKMSYDQRWPSLRLDRIARKSLKNTRRGSIHTKYLQDSFWKRADEGKIKSLFISNANPLYSMPNTDAIKKAVASIPLVVSFSSYMDESTNNADLILPNHSYLERIEDVPTPSGFTKPFVGLTKAVVPPMYNTMHTGDAIINLSKKMGGSLATAFPWDSYAACLEKSLGNKWAKLVDKGYLVNSSFKPLSSKIELNNKKVKSLRYYWEIPANGDKNAYPFILIPYDSMRLANTTVGETPFMIKTVSDTVLQGDDIFVEINPKTARTIGLSEGKTVELTTPINSAKVKVHLFEGVMPGVIAMPTGLGHSGNDPYLDGKGVNFNKLIGPVKDPDSGLNVAWGIRAKLEKV